MTRKRRRNQQHRHSANGFVPRGTLAKNTTNLSSVAVLDDMREIGAQRYAERVTVFDYSEGDRRFAESALFSPLGASGLNEWSGYLYEETATYMRGKRWYATVDEMMNTSVIAGMLFAVEMVIRQVEWHLDPAEGDDIDPEDAQQARDFVEQCRNDMRTGWEDMLAQALSFIAFGFSILEVVYKRRLGERDEQSSAYEDGLIGWDEWAPRAQRTIERWVFDKAGHATAFVQRTSQMVQAVEIDLSRCLHFKAGGYYGSPEGRSVLRPAYVDWDAIRKIQINEGIGVERDLAGMPVAMVPPEVLSASSRAGNPAIAATYTGIRKTLTGVRNNDQAGVMFPKDLDKDGRDRYEFKLMTSGGQRQFKTTEIVNRRTTQMTQAMLADFLTIGHGGTGSYALSSDKTRLFTVAISAWCDLIADTINRQAIKQLLRVNGMDRKLAPKLRAGQLDNVDLGQLGGFMGQIWPMMQATLDERDTISVLQSLFDSANLPAITATIERMDEEDKMIGDKPETPQEIETPEVEVVDPDEVIENE